MNGPALLLEAIERHKPSHVFALFSGGHDSLCATHAAMQTGKVDSVVHCNTGIGVEATRVFVRETCERYGWPLIEVRAKEDCGQDYEKEVMEFGFPGPDRHWKMYDRLKGRCLEWVERQFRQYRQDGGRKRRIPILFVSGCRSEESTRRMGHVQPVQFENKKHRVWVAIHHDQTAHQQRDYMLDHDLPRNPVKTAMCMSGECLCGSFAHKPELSEWVYHFGHDPGVQDLLRIRENVLRKFPWDWDDEGPPAWWKEQNNGQQFLCEMKPEQEGYQHLCTRCNKREEIAQEQLETERGVA